MTAIVPELGTCPICFGVFEANTNGRPRIYCREKCAYVARRRRAWSTPAPTIRPPVALTTHRLRGTVNAGRVEVVFSCECGWETDPLARGAARDAFHDHLYPATPLEELVARRELEAPA